MSSNERIICGKCYHYKDCTFRWRGEVVNNCEGFETAEEVIERNRKENNLLKIVRSPEGAEFYLDKVNDVMLAEDYSTEARKVVRAEMQAIMRLKKIVSYIDLVIYLNNIKETNK